MSLKNDLVRHQVFLQRLIKSEINALTPTIVRARVIAQDMINKGFTKKTIEKQIYEIMKLLNDLVLSRMVDIVNYEARFTYKLLLKHLDEGRREELNKPKVVPKKEQIKNIEEKKIALTTNGSPIAIGTIVDTFTTKKAKEFAQVVVDGQTKKDESSVIKGALEALAFGLIASQVKSLVTTLVNKASSIGKEDVFAENKDLVQMVIWSTELDDSVCPYCEDLEGTEMTVDEFDSQYPAHTGCRCHSEPVL